MYRHRHIDVYELAHSCIHIVFGGKREKIFFFLTCYNAYFAPFFGSPHRFHFLQNLDFLFYLLGLSTCTSISSFGFPFPCTPSLLHLSFILPPKLVSCVHHTLLLPSFFHAALLLGNTPCPGKQISPGTQVIPILPGQTHQTRSAAPRLSELPLHMQGAFRVNGVVCSDQRYLMYDLWCLAGALCGLLTMTFFPKSGG